MISLNEYNSLLSKQGDNSNRRKTRNIFRKLIRCILPLDNEDEIILIRVVITSPKSTSSAMESLMTWQINLKSYFPICLNCSLAAPAWQRKPVIFGLFYIIQYTVYAVIILFIIAVHNLLTFLLFQYRSPCLCQYKVW